MTYFTGGEDKIKAASENLHFAYVKESRMNNCYWLYIKTKEDFVIIRRKIKKNDNATIIGGWNNRGKFITLPDADDKFTRTKFKQRMKKFKRLNENGDVIEERAYTNEELIKGVTNIIYGQPANEF